MPLFEASRRAAIDYPVEASVIPRQDSRHIRAGGLSILAAVIGCGMAASAASAQLRVAARDISFYSGRGGAPPQDAPSCPLGGPPAASPPVLTPRCPNPRAAANLLS